MTASARLGLRLSVKDRQRIHRAAMLTGLPLATFVRSAVLREADRAVAAESVVALSPAESKRFISALAKPFAPNAALKRAFKRGTKLGI
jgi:uncharacterized protein (DUF1778 family)